MRTLMRPLFDGATYRSWAYAFLGAALSVPPLVVAVVSAPPGWPLPGRIAGFTLALVAVIAVMGGPRAARRGCVTLANRWLGTELPAPAAASPRSRWANRARTAAWLVPHAAVGVAATTVTGALGFAAVIFPAVWLDGGGRVDVLGGHVTVRAGVAGAWCPVVTALCLLLAAYVTAAAAAGLRLLAPVLLDHRPAERAAAAEERARLLAGRNRLARELHDSIGHTLTASTIQAAVASELLERDPAAARRALNTIEETARAAMDDLDHVLGVLREQHAPTAPARTLADLGTLAESVRRAGAVLEMTTEGALDRVPATVSREAYRIVQEGLTNALRHGAGAGITLRVAAREGLLEVELVNPVGGGARFRRGGRPRQGLAGIADRVRLLNGEVSAGPVDGPGGGGARWRLVARLPLGAGR
ncbi:histidine kinase [Streptomyces sp. NPDC019937]|uniref:sensor histidine kinase n=1 Tax=Streptomyces sp. NPDC019937 TaxID=3154787 RepID=UPI0033F08FB2